LSQRLITRKKSLNGNRFYNSKKRVVIKKMKQSRKTHANTSFDKQQKKVKLTIVVKVVTTVKKRK